MQLAFPVCASRLERPALLATAAFALVSCGRTQQTHDAGPPTIHLVGTTLVSPTGAPLAGVKICAYGRRDIPCTTSDASGNFDALLPVDSETAATFEHDGYASVLVPYVTTNANITRVGVTLPVAGDRIAMYTAFGAKCPDTTTGFVSAFVGTPTAPLGLPGVRVTDRGRAAGEKGRSTSARTEPPPRRPPRHQRVSVAFFANLAPGEATLTYAGPVGLACKRSFGGWPAPVPNAIRILVSAGFETHVAMACASPRADGAGERRPGCSVGIGPRCASAHW